MADNNPASLQPEPARAEKACGDSADGAVRILIHDDMGGASPPAMSPAQKLFFHGRHYRPVVFDPREEELVALQQDLAPAVPRIVGWYLTTKKVEPPPGAVYFELPRTPGAPPAPE